MRWGRHFFEKILASLQGTVAYFAILIKQRLHLKVGSEFIPQEFAEISKHCLPERVFFDSHSIVIFAFIFILRSQICLVKRGLLNFKIVFFWQTTRVGLHHGIDLQFMVWLAFMGFFVFQI